MKTLIYEINKYSCMSVNPALSLLTVPLITDGTLSTRSVFRFSPSEPGSAEPGRGCGRAGCPVPPGVRRAGGQDAGHRQQACPTSLHQHHALCRRLLPCGRSPQGTRSLSEGEIASEAPLRVKLGSMRKCVTFNLLSLMQY